MLNKQIGEEKSTKNNPVTLFIKRGKGVKITNLCLTLPVFTVPHIFIK